MKTLLTVIAMATAFALVGCSGSKAGDQRIRSGRGTGAGGTGAGVGGIPGATNTSSGQQIVSPQQANGLQWGQITPVANGSMSANDTVRAFLSTDFTADQVGNTASPCQMGPGLQGQPCTIRFTVTVTPAPNYAPVSLSSGVLSTALNSSTPVYTTAGFLTIVVWDDKTGTNVSSDFPQGLPPIPTVIPLSNDPNGQYGAAFVSRAGVVQGYNSQVNLIAADNEGAVGVFGNVSGNQLTGIVYFNNSVTRTSADQPPASGGQSGELGTFSVGICDVLGPCS